MRECYRHAAGLAEAPSRARAALGAAAVGGVATAAYAAYGGFGNGNGGAGGKGFGGGGRGGGGGGRAELPARGAGVGVRVRLRSAATVATVEEVVLLDVRGMHCGGCTANVKRILEMERACVSASVNLANESALVRVAVDVQGILNTHTREKARSGEPEAEASPKATSRAPCARWATAWRPSSRKRASRRPCARRAAWRWPA